jgi:carbonic anhydrase
MLAAMAWPALAAAQAQPGPATTRLAAAPPTAASPGAAEDDALLELRQRLVERLSGNPQTPRNSTDLTLSPRPPAARAQSQRPAATAAAAAPASSPRPSAKPAARPAVDASAAPAGPAAAWSYDGATGPAAWGTLRPEYALCAQGQRQSPIDLHGGLPVDLEPVRFDYRPSRFGVLDTGRTLQVGVASGNHIDLGGRRFELRRVRFHHPAEHQIDGRRFALSAHLEHEDAEGRQVVVAVLFDPGPVQPVLQALWSHIPLEPQQEQAARINVDFAGLLPADRRYYTYMGSATVPRRRSVGRDAQPGDIGARTARGVRTAVPDERASAAGRRGAPDPAVGVSAWGRAPCRGDVPAVPCRRLEPRPAVHRSRGPVRFRRLRSPLCAAGAVCHAPAARSAMRRRRDPLSAAGAACGQQQRPQPQARQPLPDTPGRQRPRLVLRHLDEQHARTHHHVQQQPAVDGHPQAVAVGDQVADHAGGQSRQQHGGQQRERDAGDGVAQFP